ncbi:glutathione S-transferase [Pochonia chlamydosporia 170]|uniref:Glutathione S-transferase n=1 Tax=Pochonia chlamydosporia 170 TaxID=1380566 RepID=A0A179FF89_METCM|nr:glutathione S-transferase [Pochonia chlamydosporia 170]OAQ63719.1 glutathione S-transferase [Pochonia chlamydosporia 170]
MPQPDIGSLGVCYRRVPVLAIGRDIYLDSRLQIAKLELLYSDIPPLGANDPSGRAVQAILSRYINDGGVFAAAVHLLPSTTPGLLNVDVLRDRFHLLGFDIRESIVRNRPNALIQLEATFDFIESTLLSNDRKWILETETPGLADLEAIWPIAWIIGIRGALPSEKFSPAIFPNVYSWVARFNKAVAEARNRIGEPEEISGSEAAALIRKSTFFEGEDVIKQDLRVSEEVIHKGDMMTIGPSDYGRTHRENGPLLSMNSLEVVIEAVEQNPPLRIHAPRHGFVVQRKEAQELAKL